MSEVPLYSDEVLVVRASPVRSREVRDVARFEEAMRAHPASETMLPTSLRTSVTINNYQVLSINIKYDKLLSITVNYHQLPSITTKYYVSCYRFLSITREVREVARLEEAMHAHPASETMLPTNLLEDKKLLHIAINYYQLLSITFNSYYFLSMNIRY